MKKFTKPFLPSDFEYRLNPCLFYFKFVKRDALVNEGGLVISLDHFEKISSDPAHKGKRGGLRLSYQSLNGRYIRPSAFIDLVSCGYIGCYAKAASHLQTIIDATLADGKSIVAAIQSPIKP